MTIYAGDATGAESAAPAASAAQPRRDRRRTDRTPPAPLFERDRELTRLRGLLAEAAAGRGGALVILGEAGVGKSALLTRALGAGPTQCVIEVTGSRPETGSPYAALERLFRQARARDPGPAASDLDPLGAFSGDAVSDARLLRDAVLTASSDQPAVVIIEGAQWTDRASLAVFGAFARRLVDAPLALIITSREDQPGPELAGIGHMQLKGLHPDKVAKLVSAVAACPVAPGVAAALAWASAGNPQAVIDMVSNLSVDQLSGRLPLSGPYLVGSRLIEAFGAGLSSLPGPARQAVTLVAATGGRLAVLERSLERAGLSPADLQPAEDLGLLRLSPSRVAFRHPLSRAAVFAAASPAERRWARTTAAEALISEAHESVPDAHPAHSAAHRPEPSERWDPSQDPAGQDYSVQLLGRFAVHRLSSDVTPSQAQPAQAVKIVALRGQIPVDELVESLWPGAEPGVGRVRLRNVLSRVQHACPGLLAREGDQVLLGRNVSVDAHVFEREAVAVLAAPSSCEASELVDRATLALALYAGELLPTDRYAGWTSVERERLAARHRELLAVLVDQNEQSGNVTAAVRLLEDAIALEPYDESLCIRAAGLMAALGWRSRAVQMLRRAEAVAADLGVAPSRAASELRAKLAAS